MAESPNKGTIYIMQEIYILDNPTSTKSLQVVFSVWARVSTMENVSMFLKEAPDDRWY